MNEYAEATKAYRGISATMKAIEKKLQKPATPKAPVFVHAQKSIVHPWGHMVEVDSKLVPLIKAIWDHDVLTHCSCEDLANGFGYITLAHPEMQDTVERDTVLAIWLAQKLARVTDIWLDLGPSGAVLRFLTKDISKLCKVLKRDNS